MMVVILFGRSTPNVNQDFSENISYRSFLFIQMLPNNLKSYSLYIDFSVTFHLILFK